MGDIDAIRGKIDGLDSKISLLLKERFKLVLKILELKQKKKIKIRQPDREKKILGKVSPELSPIFKEILKQSRKFQAKKWKKKR